MKWKDRFLRKKNTSDPITISGVDQGPVPNNPIDRAIVEHGNIPVVSEIYKARWVWYHTLLAIGILCTNILLIAILTVLAFK